MQMKSQNLDSLMSSWCLNSQDQHQKRPIKLSPLVKLTHQEIKKKKTEKRDLTSGLMQILRTNCIPHIPTATPTAANNGYTYA